MMLKTLLSFTFFILAVTTFAQAKTPVPSARQQQWAKMEYYFFIHFGPNTFTDLEWGKGTEKEEVFNPTELDCRQWCRIAKAAGAKGIIITAKHHDGFCLWPSKYSTHTVRESKWKNGKGDVLKMLSAACKEYGLKMGVYLSPWDRNHPKYGTAEYNEVFVNMMKEVVHNYGPFFEFWWDGANGEGPNGKKQVYDWNRFQNTMRTIAPNTAVFSDIGPDIRWVGNENGFAGKTNWDLLDTAGFTRGAGAPSQDTLNTGNKYGANWIPAECDVSIRPGWFYHEQEDEKVKTPQQLFELYEKSVGRNAALLLNVPPDRRGLINEHDSAALVGFKKLRDESFKTNLLTDASITIGENKLAAKKLSDNNDAAFETLAKEPIIHIVLKTPQEINCILLQEYLLKGQNIAQFNVTIKDDKNNVIKEITATTMGRKRMLTFQTTTVKSFDVTINEAKQSAAISNIAAYLIDDSLVEKE